MIDRVVTLSAKDPGPLSAARDLGQKRDKTRLQVEELKNVLLDNADDALIAAAELLIAAGYRIVPPGVEDAHLADPARDEDTVDLDGESRTPTRTVPSQPLSAREIEVLSLLAEGAPNKVIARKLAISVHTAKFHVASILAKLGAANRTDAIATAMREGLVLI